MPVLLEKTAELPAAEDAATDCELTILMPCLNEARTLPACIEKAQRYLRRSGVKGEVVIADNGSTDGSQAIASALGARVVPVPLRGYGAALGAGIRAARGRYVVMGDSDDSYDFEHLDAFVEKLREGHELVMGNRFKGGIKPGAMPPLHRYLGNPVLTFIGRLFFGSPSNDFHCGLRGFEREAILRLGLTTQGMEFASEMVVKATLRRLRITEVPTTLSKDGRDRPPHLRSWRDGWRHLKFLLVHSPRWLFLYPGVTLTALGLALMAAVLPGPLALGGVVLDVHSLMMAMASTLLGLQFIVFFLLAKQFAINHDLLPLGETFDAYRRAFTLERALMLGGVVVLAGAGGTFAAIATWGMGGFGDLNYQMFMRGLVPSLTALLAGCQIAIGAFLAAILDLGRRG
ncbi:glycosyltransferase family 2 protein [Arenibaculum pallidiluteum]|uniref:glycosyltransferase family 2 protein n=1 Tax=Arenibaculum pallidiluteum TaxID=2812559 RepID=UPI001A974944|nr:glycosyltransferase family 2 protein [Arenibaculum pallidiluteum]